MDNFIMRVFQVMERGGAAGPRFCGYFKTEKAAEKRREELTENARKYDHGGIYFTVSEQLVRSLDAQLEIEG